MAMVLGRWALLAFGYVSPSLGQPPSQSSRTIDRLPNYGAVDLSSGFGIPQPAINGTPSFVRFQDPPPELRKRECFSNGTNYCFGNNVNYCASCGTCCTDSSSKWCCPADGICCGSACCGSGQTCNSGKCYLPPVTVTVGSTEVVTITQTYTKIDTVVEQVLETSTINSVVDITITDAAATETDWSYVTITVTAVNKRSLPTPLATRTGRCQEQPVAVSSLAEPDKPKQTALLRRQEPERPATGVASTVTVSDVVTETSAITDIISQTISTAETSTVFTTIFQTHTKVMSAKATVQATSTLTFTSKLPTTITSTHTATDPGSAINPGSSKPTNTTVPSPSPATSTGLSTPTIAGIAVGSAIFALLVAILIFAWAKWRKRQAQRAQEYEDTYLGIGGQNSYSGSGYEHMRQPTLPSVPQQFVAAAPPHHRHSSGLLPGRPGHTRSSSGYTSSTAVAGSGGQTPKPKRVSSISNAGYSAVGVAEMGEDDAVTSPAEVGGRELHQRPYEVLGDETHPYEVADTSLGSSSPGLAQQGGGGQWAAGNMMNYDSNPHPNVNPAHGAGYYRDF